MHQRESQQLVVLCLENNQDDTGQVLLLLITTRLGVEGKCLSGVTNGLVHKH